MRMNLLDLQQAMGDEKCMRILRGKPERIKPLRLYSHRPQNNN
jgi:hypothetical protein